MSDNFREQLARLLAGQYYDRALADALRYTSLGRAKFIAQKWTVFDENVTPIIRAFEADGYILPQQLEPPQ